MNSKRVRNTDTETPNNFQRNVLLASIPVIGSIIIALVSQPSLKCNTNPSQAIADTNAAGKINQLKIIAGKINEDIVFRHYDEVRANMVEGLKPMISKEIFEANLDTVSITLGNYIKPLDTSYSKINNTDVLYIRNQYQRGIHLVQIIFDNQEKIFGLFSTPHPQ
jgi:hypothetical protein